MSFIDDSWSEIVDEERVRVEIDGRHAASFFAKTVEVLRREPGAETGNYARDRLLLEITEYPSTTDVYISMYGAYSFSISAKRSSTS